MRPTGRTGVLLCMGVTAVLMGVAITSAGASEKLHSFDGTCSFQGTSYFSPPATNTVQSLTVTYKGPGTCDGTLDGRRVSNAPVTAYNIARNVQGSCPQARTTTPGDGSFTFADGTTIRFSYGFTSVATEVSFTFTGERSGSGTGHGTFATTRTPPDVTVQCAGNGAPEVPLDLTLTTDRPVVSGRGGGRDDRGSGKGRAKKRLHLAARPRSARVGRRTAFAFRVGTPDGRAARGAVVRFAGRRARASRTGVARFVARFRRPGRRTARAAKPGFRAARATIRIRD